MKERKGLIEFAGRPATVVGEDLRPGDKAPYFTVMDQNWNEASPLEETRGKVRIIASVTSLDTSVCDRETRKFNQEASDLGSDIVIIVISMDLPEAQKRWCGDAGIDQVRVLSDSRYGDFGEKYAVQLKEPRMNRRAVFIVDENDIVRYAEYMARIPDEPNYEEVLNQARTVLTSWE
jgi:thiol peroxidase